MRSTNRAVGKLYATDHCINNYILFFDSRDNQSVDLGLGSEYYEPNHEIVLCDGGN